MSTVPIRRAFGTRPVNVRDPAIFETFINYELMPTIRRMLELVNEGGTIASTLSATGNVTWNLNFGNLFVVYDGGLGACTVILDSDATAADEKAEAVRPGRVFTLTVRNDGSDVLTVNWGTGFRASSGTLNPGQIGAWALMSEDPDWHDAGTGRIIQISGPTVYP